MKQVLSLSPIIHLDSLHTSDWKNMYFTLSIKKSQRTRILANIKRNGFATNGGQHHIQRNLILFFFFFFTL